MIPYARNVEKMVDTYSGNPKALMDKYAKDPQVAYLLALGEVKKRRQDLERQQAMQQPQQMPTVMQSLEQEAGMPPVGQGGIDQRQVAQNVGGVLNFQQQKQQEAIKKLAASGIAGAQGAQNVMPPQAMAAGGIVAFQAGGRFTEQMAEQARALEERINRAVEVRRQAENRLNRYSSAQQRIDPQGYQAAKQEVEQARAAQTSLEREYSELTRVNPLRVMPVPRDVRALAEATSERATPEQPAAAPVRPEPLFAPQGDMTGATAPSSLDRDMFPLGASELQNPRMRAALAAAAQPSAPAGVPAPAGRPPTLAPGEAYDAAAQLPAPAAPAAAPMPVQPGIAGLSQSMQSLGDETASAARRMMSEDPRARALEREERFERRMALTPEQRGTYEQYQKDLERFYADRARQQKDDELTSALIGAAGKSTFGLTGAGIAAGAMGARQRAANENLQGIEALNKARTGLIDIERANVRGALGAGEKEREFSGLEARQGLESAGRLYGTAEQAETARQKLAQERELAMRGYGLKERELAQEGTIAERKLTSAELDRSVQERIRQAQVAATQAAAQGRTEVAALQILTNLENGLRDDERGLRTAFREDNQLLLARESQNKLTPAEKTQLDLARANLDKQLKDIKDRTKPIINSLRARAMSGWDVKPE
jgi:hypothetical protein